MLAQVVKATKRLSNKIEEGCIGTVVYVHEGEHKAYEVEFYTDEKEWEVLTVAEEEIEAVNDKSMKTKDIINEWDPACLFPMAPKDEYADEIRKIEEYISSVDELRPEALAGVINEIFLSSFGSDVYTVKNEDCFEIAKKICEVYLWNCVC